MNVKNGEIILCKGIKLDKEYENVLSYSESSMVSLCRNNKIATANNYIINYSILDPTTNSIDVPIPYKDCIYANYIAFKNPQYGDKWFFAFVNHVKYIDNRCTTIEYKVDVFSTWFSRMNIGQAFIEREHVDDDTIGKHLVEEGLEIGDVVIHDKDVKLDKYTDYCIVIGITSFPSVDGDTTPAIPNDRTYNGIYSGLAYIIPSSATDASKIIRFFEEDKYSEAIVEIFMYYKTIDIESATEYTWTHGSLAGGTETAKLRFMPAMTESDELFQIPGLIMPKDLDGYIPKNNKLFTSPYCYINASNNAGIVQQYKWELFHHNVDIYGDHYCSFNLISAICPGGSGKAMPMQDYGQYESDGLYDYNYMYSIPLAKLPACSWLSDTYTNWLTQNGIASTGLTESLMALGGGAVTGNWVTAGVGLIGIYQSLQEIQEKKNAPDLVKGNTNSGDINFAYQYEGGFSLYNMTITATYAKRIDDFLSRFGYKINEVKTPNIYSREQFNFIKVGGSDELVHGDIPASDLDEINKIFRKGVTIFHNYGTFGNYLQDNAIVTE